MRMMEVFVLKFKTVSKVQLPVIRAKEEKSSSMNTSLHGPDCSNNNDFKVETKDYLKSETFALDILNGNKADRKPKYEFPSHSGNYSLADCQSLVKTLICGVKSVAYGIVGKKYSDDNVQVQSKLFMPNKTFVFIRLLKYALEAVDVFSVTFPTISCTSLNSASVVSQEEKEVLGHLAGVYTCLHPHMFKEVFTVMIGHMVDRLCTNSALQVLTNSFLANSDTSTTFARILIEYLLRTMHEMGSNTARSNVHVELYKMVLSSLTFFPAKNEKMLKPYLQQIVNLSTELALTAKEPHNYYQLLITLFDAIGKGDHELMFMDFLSILPTLLEKFNRLLSRNPKPMYRELFVELCLAVPVTLSSWLPYLDKLMYPLIAAINGSASLITQGLSTLEVCATSFQPFASECLEPVRAELMQALWQLLRSDNAKIAQTAFKVLGKFGGINRESIMIHPQELNYETGSSNASITVCFPFPNSEKRMLRLPVGKVIEKAYDVLISNDSELFYQEQSWEAIKAFLSATIDCSGDYASDILKFFCHRGFCGDINPVLTPLSKCGDEESRKTMKIALAGMLVSASKKQLRDTAIPFMIGLTYHYTAVMVGQECGVYIGSGRNIELLGMDPLVLIDAITTAVQEDDSEVFEAAKLALAIIVDTSSICMASESKASHLPFLSYLVENIISLCYNSGWHSKRGGCIMVQFVIERMPARWVFLQIFPFIKALFFVMMDLATDVSSGTIDLAKSIIDQILTEFCGPILEDDDELIDTQRQVTHDIINELIRLLMSSDTCVRNQAIRSLHLLASVNNISAPELLLRYQEMLLDIIPPEEYNLQQNPISSQIAMIEAISFCLEQSLSLPCEPKLYEIDLENCKHKALFDELKSICELDDDSKIKQPVRCYYPAVDLVPLRVAALRLLSLCYYIENQMLDIFKLLYKNLGLNIKTVQIAAFESLKHILSSDQLATRVTCLEYLSTLPKVTERSILSQTMIVNLSYLSALIPVSLTPHCDLLLQHLKSLVMKGDGENVDLCLCIIRIFTQISDDTSKLIWDMLCLILDAETGLMLEAGSPFREPVVKFLSRYPVQTIKLLLSEQRLQYEQAGRFITFLFTGEKGEEFRDCLKHNSYAVVNVLSSWFKVPPSAPDKENPTPHLATSSSQMRKCYVTIKILSVMTRHDELWLVSQEDIMTQLGEIWVLPEFIMCQQGLDIVDFSQWKVPKLIVKCLLCYFKHFNHQITLLFNLLRVFTGQYLPNFEFFRKFLEFTVAGTYSVEWKRQAFFEFVNVFKMPSYSQELKAKILQYVIIPCFAVAFKNHDVSSVVNGLQCNPNVETNIISIFINEVVDPKVSTNCSDSVRILLLQLSSLFVEKAHQHIQFTTSRTEENKLRQLMTFAWPCLLTKNCVDPAAKYHGHLLLASIIAKFTIHKKIVLQVFHSLLKAHVQEARTVVQQALEILTPVMPMRMEDNNSMLTHWTKKIMVEEDHTLPQLVHLLQLLVRHYKVYKPVRHHLIQHMINSVQRLCNMSNVQLEHKKLAIDVAEVIIRWELERKEEQAEGKEAIKDDIKGNDISHGHNLSKGADEHESKNIKIAASTSTKSATPEPLDPNRPIEKEHADAVVNFLLHTACQVIDASSSSSGLAGEQLSRRCILLLKTAMEPNLWPNADLKVAWLDTFLNTVESQQPNYSNACIALELLTFYVFVKREEPSTIVSTIKPLQPALILCMKNHNTKVIQGMQNFIFQLMNVFPFKVVNGKAYCMNSALNNFYSKVDDFITSGLRTYENAIRSTDAGSRLCTTVMVLKGACMSDSAYIDHLMGLFIPVLVKVINDYLDLQSDDTNAINTELVMISLELIKNRCHHLDETLQAVFMNSVLIVLIEKCSDTKILKALISTINEWITAVDVVSPPPAQYIILLLKKMECFEQRFPNEPKLNYQYLELVHRIYSEETLISPQCHSTLGPAFMAGLRCINPYLRTQFITLESKKLPCFVFQRIMSLLTDPDWKKNGHHFWIKQFIELILTVSSPEDVVSCPVPDVHLPSLFSIINEADPRVRESYFALIPMKFRDVTDHEESNCDFSWKILLDKYCVNDFEASGCGNYWSLRQQVRFSDQIQFLAKIQREKTLGFLNAASQLCHLDTKLAETFWIQLFPNLWGIFDDHQRNVLSGEIIPFLCNEQPTTLKEVYPNPVSVLAESMFRCTPRPEIKPDILNHLGVSLNMWHQVGLELENMYFGAAVSNRSNPPESSAFSESYEESLSELTDLYSKLKEDDLWTAVWMKNSIYPELGSALAFESQGLFYEAKQKLEKLQERCKEDEGGNDDDDDDDDDDNIKGPVTSQKVHRVKRLAFDRWVRCAEQLADWNSLIKFVKTSDNNNSFLLLDNHFRSRKWQLLKESLIEVESSPLEQLAWKANLFKGYLSICHPEDRDLSVIEQEGKICSSLCIKAWNKLPPIISHCHIPLLQAAQQIIELKDAAEIHDYMEQQKYLYMRAIIKKWPDRLPSLSDDFSYWTALHSWRDIHMLDIAYRYSAAQDEQEDFYSYNHLGLFAYIHSNITLCTLARKQGNPKLCLKGLAVLRVEEFPRIPPVFMYQKLKQMLKCHLHLSVSDNEDLKKKHLNEGLALINNVNLNVFEEKHRSELCALKGVFCYHLNHEAAADIEFTTAIQIDNKQMKSWAMYGEFLEKLFMREIPEDWAYDKGSLAIVAYMNACQLSRETMSRKYLARTLWMLTFDNDAFVLGEHFMQYSLLVEAHHWTPWLPQLVASMGRPEGKYFRHLLCHLGCKYPSAVYFPLRTLYHTLRANPQQALTDPDIGSYLFNLERNFSFMQTIRPPAFTALQRIEQELIWFKENAFEDTLRDLRQVLNKVFDSAFDKTMGIFNADVSIEVCNSINKLASNFESDGEVYIMDSQESVTARAQFLRQDPVYAKMKAQLDADFNFNIPGAKKFHCIIGKLKKWIKVFEAKLKFLPKSFMLEERCKYLSEFTQEMANLEIPGELLYPKPNVQCVTIAQFMPKIDVVHKYNTVARRLNIRGHNGKIYPYLIVSDTLENNSRSEERVLQFFRFINTYLLKQKETLRRFLNITVPRVTPLTPYMRIIEDHVQSLSFFDIYRQHCERNNVDPDAPLLYYHERLAALKMKGSNRRTKVLRDILDYIQDNMVPTTILKDWALQTHPTATDYWTFRKQFTLQHSLISFFEYCLYLNFLNPDLLYIHPDTGKADIISFCLEINEKGLLECTSQPVPFRLTPNILNFITEHGKNGPMASSMIAIARCLVQPKFQLQYILKAILKEEVFDWYNIYREDESKVDTDIVINRVMNAVNAIWVRLDCLAVMEDGESNAKTLCTVANSRDSICMMKPTWHPWL